MLHHAITQNQPFQETTRVQDQAVSPLEYQHTAPNQTGVAAITVLGAINLNNTAITGISAEQLFPKQLAKLVDEDSSGIVLSNLVSPVQSEVLS